MKSMTNMDRLKASINTGQNNCHENRTSILHCGGPKNARVQQNQRIRKHIFSKAKGIFHIRFLLYLHLIIVYVSWQMVPPAAPL